VGSELLHFDPATGAATVRYPALRIIQEPENSATRPRNTLGEEDPKQEESIRDQMHSHSSLSSGTVAQNICRGS